MFQEIGFQFVVYKVDWKYFISNFNSVPSADLKSIVIQYMEFERKSD